MKKVRGYDQKIPQTHTADQPRHREEELHKITRHQENKLKQPALSSLSR